MANNRLPSPGPITVNPQPGDPNFTANVFATAPPPVPAQPSEAANGIVPPQPSVTSLGPTNAPPAVPQPQPVHPAVAAQVARDAHHGSVWRSIWHALEGKNVAYQVDPKTGQTHEIVSQAKPGEFFRRVVGGM